MIVARNGRLDRLQESVYAILFNSSSFTSAFSTYSLRDPANCSTALFVWPFKLIGKYMFFSQNFIHVQIKFACNDTYS